MSKVKGKPPLVCFPSFGYAEIHPFVALLNAKEFRRLRAATNARALDQRPLFEKSGGKTNPVEKFEMLQKFFP